MEIKTTMTTCPNGHPYDAAKHGSCPFCGAQAGGFTPTEPLGGGSGFTPTEPLGGSPGSFSATEAPGMGGGMGNFSATEAPNNMGRGGGYASSMGPTIRPDGRGGGPIGGGPDPFGSPTIIGGDQRADGSQSEPVVGWLVCIEGPVRGTDFRIHAGYNYVGREAGDIHIHGDQQISRQNHAMVAYDSGDHTYFVGPSAGRNLIKVNGKTVLNAVEIKNYDIISIGSTKLIFVGLCGEQFSWDKREGGNG